MAEEGWPGRAEAGLSEGKTLGSRWRKRFSVRIAALLVGSEAVYRAA